MFYAGTLCYSFIYAGTNTIPAPYCADIERVVEKSAADVWPEKPVAAGSSAPKGKNPHACVRTLTLLGGQTVGKKVLMIDGSARRRNTYNILLQIEQVLKTHGTKVEILNLFDYQIEDCIGCEACVSCKECAKKDDMPILMRKIMDSDGLILSSPVYMSCVTSRFKTFADRTNTWVHKPETVGKPVMFVATTASTGLKETKRFFELFATGFGARKGGLVARSGKTLGKPVQEKELSRFLTLLAQDKRYYRPAMSEIVMFTVGKVLATKSTGDDRRFWEEREWLNRNYYYPCKMGPVRNLFSKLMFRVISNAMR